MDIKKRIGQKIKSLREMTGKTQEEYGEILGKTRGAIADLEAGRYKPSIDTILTIHKYHNISTDEILCCNDDKKIKISGL